MSSKNYPVRIGCCLAALAAALSSPGCGRSLPANRIVVAEAAVEEGLNALSSGDYTKAEGQFTIGLSGGLTRPDLVEQALLGRARSRIALKKFDEAQADLDELSEGAGDLDQVWVVRAEFALQSGDKDAAKLAYLEAKKINRRLTIPPELK